MNTFRVRLIRIVQCLPFIVLAGCGSSHVTSIHHHTIYAATDNGLSVSKDDGAHWSSYYVSNGIRRSRVSSIFVSGSTLYACYGGRSFNRSTDGGLSWATYPLKNVVHNVVVSGSTIYAATGEEQRTSANELVEVGGLAISRDSGRNWKYVTKDSGLAGNYVKRVQISGSKIYVCTMRGLSVSDDGGTSWKNYTHGNGLRSDSVQKVYVVGSTIYAAIAGGVAISKNSGATWTNCTVKNGVGSDDAFDVTVVHSKIYAATAGGVSVSADDGRTWKNYTTANGLGENLVMSIAADDTNIYAATENGLSISTDDGQSWKTYWGDSQNGLPVNDILVK
jgi:photosystem II stability/assembly factor-like uncharacterized protein